MKKVVSNHSDIHHFYELLVKITIYSLLFFPNVLSSQLQNEALPNTLQLGFNSWKCWQC